MVSISMPNQELYEALKKIEASAASITVLRKQKLCNPLHNIISGLWLAILYRAVEQRPLKNSRKYALDELTVCLRAGREITMTNANYDKTISKRLRSGRISWSTISIEPGLLAVFSFSTPPSKEVLCELQSCFEDGKLLRSASCYRPVITRILLLIKKIVSRTKILYAYLANTLREVSNLVKDEIHCQADDVQPPSVSLYNHDAISFEAMFNKSTHPHYRVEYDSPIFICVQSGDIHGARTLLQQGVASIHDVDPYNLGLLYYASYYCWRSYGAIKAIQMCEMLIQVGVDINLTDEIGNAPIYTMTDSAMVERYGYPKLSALIKVGLFCDMTSQELVEEHQSSCKLTALHKTLLGINPEYSNLQGHLRSLRRLGSLVESIDKPDSRGRSALAWAVEYGMADAVRTLLDFGANVCQYRRSFKSQFPLLHLVIAGPPPPLKSGFLEVVKILLATGVDINAKDDEGWSAWHVAASWRSYDILREIMRTHGAYVELDAQTNDGALAHNLSQDEGFYSKLMPNWYE